MSGFLKGCAVGGAMGVLVLATGGALAGNGIGAVFNLGATNTVNKTSILAGSTAGAEALFYNGSTASTASGAAAYGKSALAPAFLAQNVGGGPALGLHSGQGHAPLTVDSTTKVANLNADQLDGSDASAFFPNSRVRRIVAHQRNDDGTKIATFVIGDLTIVAQCFDGMHGGAYVQFKTSAASVTGDFQVFWSGLSNTSGGSGLQHLTNTDGGSYFWPQHQGDQIGTFVFEGAHEVDTGTLAYHWGVDPTCTAAGTVVRATTAN